LNINLFISTLSITYSIKAKAINNNLLGGMPVVLPTSELTAGLGYLINNESQIRTYFESKVPLWHEWVEAAASDAKFWMISHD